MVLSTMQHVERVGNMRIKQEDLPVEQLNLLGDRVSNLEALDLTASNPSEGHFVYHAVIEARTVCLRPPEPIGPIPRPIPVPSSIAHHQTRRNPPSPKVQALVAEHRGRERGEAE